MFYFFKVKAKVVPTPRVLLTFIVWLWASMMCFTIDKPNPEPLCCIDLALSVR